MSGLLPTFSALHGAFVIQQSTTMLDGLKRMAPLEAAGIIYPGASINPATIHTLGTQRSVVAEHDSFAMLR
jgi:hypothetical protein